MNLNAYDDVTNSINKTRSWVDVNKKLLISREIKPRAYYSLLKRYDNKTNVISFFIAMLDKIDSNKVCNRVIVDDYGRVKIKLSKIWNECNLAQLETNCNICIELVESDDTGDIYYLDV